MLTPATKGMTKLAWASFYNEEAEELLRKYMGQRRAGGGRHFVHTEADLRTEKFIYTISSCIC